MLQLFPISPATPTVAQEKLAEALRHLRTTLAVVADHVMTKAPLSSVIDTEKESLKEQVETLRTELGK
jgi:hypothetical protein